MDDEESVMEFYKGIHLKEYVHMVADTWNDVKRITTERAGRKIKEILNDNHVMEEGFLSDNAVLKTFRDSRFI